MLGIDNVIVNHFSALSIYECFNKVKQYNKQKKKEKEEQVERNLGEKNFPVFGEHFCHGHLYLARLHSKRFLNLAV